LIDYVNKNKIILIQNDRNVDNTNYPLLKAIVSNNSKKKKSYYWKTTPKKKKNKKIK